MMAQQYQQLPSPPRQSIKHFCPHLQIETIGIYRRHGQYYFYCFNYVEKKFQPLECLGCQPVITEQHLYPLYAEYCNDLDTHVCFAYNNVTLKVEQFVFHQSTGGLEEVSKPNMVHDISRPLADIMCVVKETPEYGMVILQRDNAQNFKKSRAFDGQFVSLPPVLVKTLMTKKLDYYPQMPRDAAMFRPPFKVSQKSSNIIFQYCPRYHGVDLVCIRQEDQSYLRFYYSVQTGSFHPARCPECTGPVTEYSLRPFYAAHSDALGEYVIFVENMQNFSVEQYVFCKRTLGFKQVETKDVVFDAKLIDWANVILKVSTRHGMVHLSRNQNGCMDKYIFVNNVGYEKIVPKEVKTLAIQKKEREELERRAEEQRKLLEPLYVQTTDNFLKEMGLKPEDRPKYPGCLSMCRLQEALSHLDFSKQEKNVLAPKPTIQYGFSTPPPVLSVYGSSDDDDLESEADTESEETEEESEDASGSDVEGSEASKDSDDSEDSDLEEYDTCGDEDLDDY